MKTIRVKRKNGTILIDEDDYNRAKAGGWYLVAVFHRGLYRALISKDLPGRHKISMSLGRFILNMPKEEKYLQADHINRNALDNRKCNLRIATPSQNSINRTPQRKEYKGIFKRGNRWAAGIGYRRSRIIIGYYSTKIEAAKAYDNKAKELFGEFAVLNFKD